jgi:pyruvate kinase
MDQRLTKIIATMGPGLTPVLVRQLIEAGVDCFRFNYKHHDFNWHRERLEWVRRAAAESGRWVGTLLDVQGPEVRMRLPQPRLELREGDWLRLDETPNQQAYEPAVSLSHPQVLAAMEEGQLIRVGGGMFKMKLVRRDGNLFLVSQTGGILADRQAVSFDRDDLPIPTLSPQDDEALGLAGEMEVDYIALSYVRHPGDVTALRQAARERKVQAKIVAKVETAGAVRMLTQVAEEADGLMVARGDLAVEAPMAHVPYYQKKIIETAMLKGKLVVVATQMLQSMVETGQPTRAEVSDVATAAYDGTDAVMLSAETAIGKHPVEAVTAMGQILRFNEQKRVPDWQSQLAQETESVEADLCEAAYALSLKLVKHRELSGFLVFTRTGQTARYLAQLRPHLPILTFCPDARVAGGLSLIYGVKPWVNAEIYPIEPAVTPEKVLQAVHFLARCQAVQPQTTLIVLHENAWGFDRGTSSIKLVTVPE